jgi:hypothetical protein
VEEEREGDPGNAADDDGDDRSCGVSLLIADATFLVPFAGTPEADRRPDQEAFNLKTLVGHEQFG